jgi:hypothetical protein
MVKIIEKNIKSIVNTSFDYTIDYVSTIEENKADTKSVLFSNIYQVASNLNYYTYNDYVSLDNVIQKLLSVESFCVYNLETPEIFVSQGVLLKTISKIITENNYSVYFIDLIVTNAIKNTLLTKYNIVWSDMEDIDDYTNVIKMFKTRKSYNQGSYDDYNNWYE